MWTGLVWFRIGTGGELLWIRYWTFGFHKMLGNYRVPKQLRISRVVLSSMELIHRDGEARYVSDHSIVTPLPSENNTKRKSDMKRPWEGFEPLNVMDSDQQRVATEIRWRVTRYQESIAPWHDRYPIQTELRITPTVKRLQVLRAVIMKSTIFCDITLCNLLKLNICFQGTCRFYLQGKRISRAWKNRESKWQEELWFLPVIWLVHFIPWRYKRHVPPKRRVAFIAQKLELLIVATDYYTNW
jgi:hypothetical protein